MKTTLKRILTLTLCLVLLASCGTGETPTDPDTTANAEPYYYTQNVFLQMGIGEGYYVDLINIDENGTLSFTKVLTPDDDIYDFYLTISNGDVTADLSTPAGYDAEKDYKYANSVAHDGQNGNYYALFNNNDTTYEVNVYDKDLSLITEGIPYEWHDGTMNSEELHYFDGKLYFLSTKHILYINNIDGTSVDLPPELSKRDELNNILSIDIDQQGNLYFLGRAISGSAPYRIGKYDLMKDEFVYQKKISTSLVGNFYLHYNEANNCIYVADDSGIYQYDANVSIDEEVMHGKQIAVFGEDTSFIPGLNPFLNGFISDNEGNFYLAINGFDQSGNYIYKLTKTYGEKLEDNRKEIVLTSAYKQDFMIDAINRYNAISEEYKIVFDTLYENRDEYKANNENARTKILTKIMTNDVGDIITTGGTAFDIYSLFQADTFVDLSEYIKNDPVYDDLSKSILDAITINSSIYGLPLGYRTTRMDYNKTLADELGIDVDVNNAKWSDILDLVREVDSLEKNVYVFQGTADYILSYILNSNLPDLIDIQNKVVDLKQEWFLALMREFKEVSKLDCFGRDMTLSANSMHVTKDCLFAYTIPESPDGDIRIYLNAPFEYQAIPVFSGEQNSNRIAYAFIMYSISSNSENKEAAWDFLSFLLQEDIGTLNSMYSIPLNTKSVEKIYSNYEDIEELRTQDAEITNSIDTLYDMGEGYKYDLYAPIWKYINDELTLEEAIEEAEYNVWLRLNE